MLEENTNNIMHWWSWHLCDVVFMHDEESKGERGYINFVFIILFGKSFIVIEQVKSNPKKLVGTEVP